MLLSVAALHTVESQENDWNPIETGTQQTDGNRIIAKEEDLSPQEDRISSSVSRGLEGSSVSVSPSAAASNNGEGRKGKSFTEDANEEDEEEKKVMEICSNSKTQLCQMVSSVACQEGGDRKEQKLLSVGKGKKFRN